MIEEFGGKNYEWSIDADLNKICIEVETGDVVKILPASITKGGIVISPQTTYRALLNKDFLDIYGNTHPKGDKVSVNEMLNGDFFMTSGSNLISTKGRFDQFTIIVDYEKVDSITLGFLLKSAVDTEDYLEASRIKKELDSRAPSHQS